MRYSMLPLKNLLRLDIDEVPIVATESYRIAGVYGFGRGLFPREAITGAQTKYVTLNRLREGQIVVSRLKAFEGAIALVPPEFDGWFVSQEFPTFTAVKGAEPAYLGYVCQWPDFWAMLRSVSKGVGARRERVHSDELLSIRVPFPEAREQRRIIAKLDAASTLASRIKSLSSKTERIARALRAVLLGTSGPRKPVSEILSPIDLHEPVEADNEYTLLGVRWYGEGLFVRERKLGYEIAAARLRPLSAGDFVYNRLFAWKGSFALVGAEHRGAYVSNEFPLFEIDKTQALPEYLLAYFRIPATWTEAFARSTGGTPTSRNRLKEEQFLSMQVPVPTLDEQRKVVSRMRALDDILDRRRHQGAILRALIPSLLNRAFAGEL